MVEEELDAVVVAVVEGPREAVLAEDEPLATLPPAILALAESPVLVEVT